MRRRRGNRPHVVWFAEMPLEMERIYAALADCALFISIGTSGNVYPAAGFVQEARINGAHTVELNLEPSEGATLFDEKIYGTATCGSPGLHRPHSGCISEGNRAADLAALVEKARACRVCEAHLPLGPRPTGG